MGKHLDCSSSKQSRVFGWRLAKDNLPTKMNKFRRKIEVDSTCSLCGTEQETGCHATVSCTKARGLRSEMRKFWDLPSEHMFRFTGPDWLLLLLSNIAKEKRGLVLLVLWRSWHLRNDVVHGKGDAKID